MKEGKFGEISMTPKKVDKKKQIAMKKLKRSSKKNLPTFGPKTRLIAGFT